MGNALAILLGTVLTLAAVLALSAYLRFGQNPGAALADRMLEAGGERKAHYGPLRSAAFGLFAIGLCFGIWFVGRGSPPGTTHSQRVAGIIALAFFGAAAVLFGTWWWLSGPRVRGE